MARGWFYNIPFHGHVNPTLALVKALVERGDEITYFSSPAFAEKLKAVGAGYRAYNNLDVFEQSRTVAHAIHLASLVAETTYALLPEVLSAVAAERPDYLIFDMSAPWGSIAGRRYGIPALASFPHLPFYWRTLLNDRRVFRKAINSLRPGFGYWRQLRRETGRIVKDYRLRNPRDINVLSSAAELNIVFSSRYFQPYEHHFDESYVYVGPIIDLERINEPQDMVRSNGQKVIYIAVGTVYQGNMQFFKNCMEAFGGERYSVVMSIGKAVDPVTLEPVPRNFTIAQHVPQLAVLRESDLFITHGGMNSISEAIILGVPMIVVPNTIEQAINADQIERLEAGLYLDPTQLTAEKLRQAAAKAFGNPAMPKGIARIKKSFIEAGGVERAAEAVQRFKAEHNLS